jgi:D-alanyl-D-alanine carboxypeptidase
MLKQAFIALALALTAVSPSWAAKYASIVVDLETSEVLHSRSADEQRYPASLTKVMTLYMAFDALENGTLKLTDKMPVSRFAAGQQPSKLGLKSGSTIKVEDAIRALVTKSANDVAVVFAEKLGGSEAKFAAKMTARAKELGLQNTVFRNASGLPDKRQITTARDMAKLAEAIYLDHGDRYSYFSVKNFVWAKRRYDNHNTLLTKVQGVDGIKTGFTNASGYNLMASAERDGRRVVAIMLGGTTGRSRDQHVTDLLEAAFLEIQGVPATEMADIRSRISFGEAANASADDLAALQLKKFAEADTALVSLTEPEDVSVFEAELDIAEGDSDNAGEDAIGELIGTLGAEQTPAATVETP